MSIPDQPLFSDLDNSLCTAYPNSGSMVLMAHNLDQFIPLAQASQTYKVSIKTLRRRRDSLQKKADPRSIAEFIIRTREGETFDRPSKETVAELIEGGSMPEWLVNHAWLQKEFGPRPGTPTQDKEETTTPNDQSRPLTSDQSSPDVDQLDQPNTKLDPTEKLIALYENQIGDLKQQMRDMRDEHKHTVDKITGILPATIQQTQPPRIAPQTVVDTTPQKQIVKEKPRTKTTAKTKTKGKKKVPAIKQRTGIGSFLFGNRKSK